MDNDFLLTVVCFLVELIVIVVMFVKIYQTPSSNAAKTQLIKQREEYLQGLLLVEPEEIKGFWREFDDGVFQDENGVYSWEDKFYEDSKRALYLRFLIHKKGLDFKLLENNNGGKPDNNILDEPI